MAVKDIAPVSGERFEDMLASESPDLLREMIRSFAVRLPGGDGQYMNAFGVAVLESGLTSSCGRSRLPP